MHVCVLPCAAILTRLMNDLQIKMEQMEEKFKSKHSDNNKTATPNQAGTLVAQSVTSAGVKGVKGKIVE